MNFFPDFAPNSRKEWRLLLFQSNLRKQIRKLPKILKFVRINTELFTIFQNYSLVSLGARAGSPRGGPPPPERHRRRGGGRGAARARGPPGKGRSDPKLIGSRSICFFSSLWQISQQFSNRLIFCGIFCAIQWPPEIIWNFPQVTVWQNFVKISAKSNIF